MMESEIIDLIKDSKRGYTWLWDVAILPEDKKHLQTDLFNIPANGILSLELAIEALESQKPFGYVFEGKFYKSLDELSGRTFHEGNKPVAVYTKE